MNEAADLIVGPVLMNDLIFADGTVKHGVPGGAGLYALAGAALFSDHAVLVAGTGRDLPLTFGPWLERNGLTQRGLRISEEHAPRNVQRYASDTSRTETLVLGHEHFRRSEPAISDVARVLDSVRSLYVFRNADPAFWSELAMLNLSRKAHMLWDIAPDRSLAGQRPAVERILGKIDALSLGIKDAERIFETCREDILLASLQQWPVEVIFLRAGTRGSFVLANGDIDFIPGPAVEPVDVTGSGNAYGSAAALGLTLGRSPISAAAMGTVAAVLTASQFGPPESGDSRIRKQALRMVEGVIAKLQPTNAQAGKWP